MINETDNMTATDNKLLKQCKLKFANWYRLNGGVSNIPIFAEKWNAMPQHRISTLQHLKESPQWILLPHKKGDAIFIASVAAAIIFCLISFFFNSLML